METRTIHYGKSRFDSYMIPHLYRFENTDLVSDASVTVHLLYCSRNQENNRCERAAINAPPERRLKKGGFNHDE